MVQLSPTLLLSLGFSALANAALIPRQETRPIYAIAHRVIQTSAVTAALDHGANAIEIDLTPEKDGWYADHDGKGTTAGGTAREVLEFMAKQRDNGKPLTFVWLDVKNPDDCKKDEPCSIEALRDIVHDTLGKSGVRALWGFYTTTDTRSFKVIRDGLNENEAMTFSGEHQEILETYDQSAPDVPIKQRVGDYGAANIADGFGDCTEKSWNTCTELKQTSAERDDGKLGKVLSWTSDKGDTKRVEQLLGTANIDGIIYGYHMSDYDENAKQAFDDIKNYVDKNKSTLRMAGRDDLPW
ncbi:hypothetical protein PENSTE_c012G01629 [Penicillium steckii]|uniref:Phospholipase D n=1 Tax=Penicillium steckii TaxID=303698 RepID=A0A1V6T535_9EURO|nr:hypothetical protein PENSTE_c012G01629 [Penicillium steckii]